MTNTKNLLVFSLAVFFIPCNQQGDTEDKIAANPSDSLFLKYHLEELSLPAGFRISVYAEVPNARSLCYGPNGTLFVGNRTGNNVYAVVDEDKDGFGDRVLRIATGLNSPNGVAFRKGSLYVAEINRILRFDDIENNLEHPPPYQVVTDQYPDRPNHGWKFIAFGPDDKLYVPVGAPCNACHEKDSIFASITRINPDGSNLEIFAHGVRNTVGFDWQPGSDDLWFTENGRDNLGDNTPYCELNHAPRKGMHFGFPFIHQSNLPDPEFGNGRNPGNFTAPVLKVGPHAAPLGMRFYTGEQFPKKYKNQIFIAEHGSWNRSVPFGYQVKVASVAYNRVTNYERFVTGWLKPDGQVLGRPVDVVEAPDGSLLISDDMNGAVYKVTYEE